MEAVKKNKKLDFEIISLTKLGEISSVDWQKIRNNFIGKYDSLDLNEKTAIANALYLKIQVIFRYLGFEIKMTRMD